MNLKQAAAVLGVHYQTAYKWVRSGELVAVRVGGRYEVSDAAIAKFRAQRASYRTEALPAEAPTTPVSDGEDVLEELEAMLYDPLLAVRSMGRFVVRRAAETFGGMCVLTLVDADGNQNVLAVDHPNPAYATVMSSLMELFSPLPRARYQEFNAFRERRVVRLSHVPQDVFRSQLRPELQQHVSVYPVRCLLAVPIFIEGAARGSLTCMRSEPDRPHSDADEALCLQMAERIAELVSTAEDVAVAVGVRADLVQGLSGLLASQRPRNLGDELGGLFDRVANRVHLPVSIMDANRVLLLVNPAFQTIRSKVGEPVGSVFEDATHADDRGADRASFDRLASGELDFLDINLRRGRRDGEVVSYISHRAAVREPDASLRYFVSVARLLRVPTSEVVGAEGRTFRAISDRSAPVRIS